MAGSTSTFGGISAVMSTSTITLAAGNLLHLRATCYRPASTQGGIVIGPNASNAYQVYHYANTNIEIDYFIASVQSYGPYTTITNNTEYEFFDIYILVTATNSVMIGGWFWGTTNVMTSLPSINNNSNVNLVGTLSLGIVTGTAAYAHTLQYEVL